MLSDEQYESMGFKKVWIEKLNTHAWIADLGSIKLDYTKYYDLELLNMFLKYYEEQENYDECIIIRNRIQEITAG